MTRKATIKERNTLFSILQNHKRGNIEIWAVNESWGTDYYVYGVYGDPRVCPSLGMAYEVAACVS